jgi:Tyrosyl-DNA phosphodiesterase/Ubiquitin interaction motif
MNALRLRFCTTRSTIQATVSFPHSRSFAFSALLASKAARAILSQSQRAKRMPSPIDLTQESDSEDEDLKRAIALSLEEANINHSPAKPVENEAVEPVKSSGGIMGIDRKQMEQERLARLKRKRGEEAISPPPLRRTKPPPVSKAVKPSMTESSAPTTTSASTFGKSTLEFPNGKILRTWVSSHPDSQRSITFQQLIDAPNLQSALMNSFIFDFDWLFPHFRTHHTKFLLVLHAHNALHQSQLRQDFAEIPNVRLCFPSTEGIVNCMHSKLMLLFYEGRCRLVVPTANLMKFDWGEQGGVMENMVFVIDLPIREGTEKKEYPFERSLVQFLNAQGVPVEVVQKLEGFDFSATERNKIGFVHTIGGAHTDDTIWRNTGHCGLGTMVKEMGLAPAIGEDIELDFVTSSVGNLTDEFMRSIYLAAMGYDGMMELGIRQGKTAKAKGSIDSFFKGHKRKNSQDDDEREPQKSTVVISSKQAESWRSNFRFFFPTHATVANSIGGTDSAGTICFQQRWWDNSAKFPRKNMRDCVSVRKGVLMHNKLMFVRYKGDQKERKHAGWVYVGSANLSESAWGRLVVDRTKKSNAAGMNVKLNCRNWECGIVMPVAAQPDAKQGLDIFDRVIPVPMEYPGKSYEENALEPWFFGREGMAT